MALRKDWMDSVRVRAGLGKAEVEVNFAKVRFELKGVLENGDGFGVTLQQSMAMPSWGGR